MKAHFLELFDYNEQINRHVCETLLQANQLHPRARREFGHIIAAQNIWRCRLTGEEYLDIKVWPTPTVEECQELSNKSSREWNTFVSQLSNEDFDRSYEYTDTGGTGCETILRHALVHLRVLVLL